MRTIDEGTPAMADDDLSRLTASTLDDLDIAIRALHDIASEAVEGEIVRLAMVTLQNTEAGRRYLADHPLTT